MTALTLLVEGVRYGGWESMQVQRAMDHLAGGFSLSVSERWAGQTTPRPIRPGQACQVLLGETPVITGYVDTVSASCTDKGHGINVQGRDKTADLIDCAAKQADYKAQTLYQIAFDQAQAFGISVVDQVGDTTRVSRRVSKTSAAFDALKKLAAERAVLLTTNGAGELVITRASKTRIATVLQHGKNILSGHGHFSMERRFSEYEVVSQAPGNDYNFGPDAADISATAKDDEVARYRPKVIQSHEPELTPQAQADYQMRMRRGRSQKVTYKVPGWTHADGLWAPNTLVHVTDPLLGIDLDMLIASVTYTEDTGGQLAALALVRPETYDILAKPQSTGVQQWDLGTSAK